MKIKDFKIHHLTSEQFEIVQKTIFNNGCTWVASDTIDIKNYNCEDVTVVLDNTKLRSGREVSESTFNSLCGEILTFEQFKIKYIINNPEFTKQQMFDFAQFCANNNEIEPNDELLNQFLNT